LGSSRIRKSLRRLLSPDRRFCGSWLYSGEGGRSSLGWTIWEVSQNTSKPVHLGPLLNMLSQRHRVPPFSPYSPSPLTSRHRCRSLIRASVLSSGDLLLAPIVPRIVLALATFAQPLLVKDILEFIQNRDRPIQVGWALVGGFVVVYAVMVLSMALYWEKVSPFLSILASEVLITNWDV
jgi:hypothetical protein